MDIPVMLLWWISLYKLPYPPVIWFALFSPQSKMGPLSHLQQLTGLYQRLHALNPAAVRSFFFLSFISIKRRYFLLGGLLVMQLSPLFYLFFGYRTKFRGDRNVNTTVMPCFPLVFSPLPVNPQTATCDTQVKLYCP